MTAAEGAAPIPLAVVEELLDTIAGVYDLPPASPLEWPARESLMTARAQHVRGLLGGRRRTVGDVHALITKLRQLDAEPDLAVKYDVAEVRR